MLSKFFIEHPIFSSVISIVIVKEDKDRKKK